ncbi:MAG: efflux RND transporter periplasmic adaptor subunit [Ruminococcaceae bacterium]|nr:efflux RND transporter periplasmic adaptor subunit [Oscillospiraceae bacterium]
MGGTMTMKLKKPAVFGLAFVMLLSLAACGEKNEPVQGDAPATGIAVQVETVTADTLATENKVSGMLATDSTSTVMITVTAKCTAVHAKAGDEVKAGDILCTLDLSSTQSSYQAALISYNSAVQSYQDQKAILDKQVKLAEDNVANTRALLAIGAASQLEVDQAELSYQSAVAGRNATLAQLEAAVQNAKSGVEQLDTALENVDAAGNVVAPASGTLVSINATENVYVSPSSPLAVIDGEEEMKIVVSVSEALVPKLSVGDTASVSVGAAEQEFAAVIRSVERMANMQTKLYTVTLAVPAEADGLLSGMSADVIFHTGVSRDTIVIPTEAILTSNGKQYVYVVENDVAHYVEIVTGLTGSGVTEVVSGLEAGQQLVTVGQAYLMEGDAVRIVSGEA